MTGDPVHQMKTDDPDNRACKNDQMHNALATGLVVTACCLMPDDILLLQHWQLLFQKGTGSAFKCLVQQGAF